MAADKKTLGTHRNLLTASGLNNKQITGVEAYVSGDTTIVELSYSGGSSFVKFNKGRIQIDTNQDFTASTAQFFADGQTS